MKKELWLECKINRTINISVFLMFQPSSLKAVHITKEICMTKLYQNGIFHKHLQLNS